MDPTAVDQQSCIAIINFTPELSGFNVNGFGDLAPFFASFDQSLKLNPIGSLN